MHKNILCICALCARVWGTLRAQTPESRKLNRDAPSNGCRAEQAVSHKAGETVRSSSQLGTGQKCFRCAVRPETFRKELFPRPPSPRRGGEADEGQPKRHPVREGDLSRRGRKAEAAESRGADSVTLYAQAHNVRVSGI